MSDPRPSPLPRHGDNLGPNGRRFAWGPIDAVHTIGDYQIVEYRDDKSNCGQPEYWGEHNQTRFHPFIGGRDTDRSYFTLDSALVGAIAYKREGGNGRAAVYFDRMTCGAA